MFDNDLFFNNVAYLLKDQDKRTGKFETDAGVKPGYISRMSKDSDAKPGIDFIMNAAELLGVSLSTILHVNLSELNPTELYLQKFFDKLLKETAERKLDWEVEHPEFLNHYQADYNGFIHHPLLSEETFHEKTEMEYPQEVTRIIFKSHSYGCNTYIAGDCYNLRLKNGIMLYLMFISPNTGRFANLDRNCEVWMHNPSSGGSQFVASAGSKDLLGPLVNELYLAVAEYNRHPKINPSLCNAIDAFMNGDLTDDPVNMEDIQF